MSVYPILVERWTGAQALTIICERCHAERVIDADEISNEDIYECPGDRELGRAASTVERCRGSAMMKYLQAEKCRGCGKLGFFGDPHCAGLEGCCSRRCQLQAEYAATLRGAA